MTSPASIDRFAAVPDARPIDAPWPPMLWPPAPGVRLTGHTVELAPLDRDRDLPALFGALDHDSVWRHMPVARPRDVHEYVQIAAWQGGEGRFPWIVRLLESCGGVSPGAVVGTSSYLDVSARDARVEIGATAYTPAVWATKVNPEAKLLLLTHAFDTLRVGRVQFKTDARNVRSQQAIARLGAHYEGTLRRHQRRGDGTVRDSVLFSIVAEDWPAVRERLTVRVGAP